MGGSGDAAAAMKRGDCVADSAPIAPKLLKGRRRAGHVYIEGKGGSPPTPAGHGHPRGPQLA